MTSPANARERLLEAGTRAIVAKSYNGCGLAEILGAAGVPKGSFYHYFKSKEDFGVAVIERATEEHAQWMRELLSDRRQPAVARLRRLFDEMRNHYAEVGPKRECLIAKLALELCELSEPMRGAIKYSYDLFSAIIAKTLREAQAEASICPKHDPDALASFLTNAWEGATIRMQIDRNLEPIEEYIDYVFNRLLQAHP